jgi:hypothetical protein
MVIEPGPQREMFQVGRQDQETEEKTSQIIALYEKNPMKARQRMRELYTGLKLEYP